MSRGSTAAALVFAAVLVILGLAVGYRVFEQAASIEGTSPIEADEQQAHESFLYGRISTRDGARFEGRLRWGGNQEAFWGDYFNGAKKENPWAAHVPPGRLPSRRRAFDLFGFEIFASDEPVGLTRLFMARFGDLARVEASGNDVRVTLKSGTVFVLDRLSAGDFDDGVLVWDGLRGPTSLDSLRIRTIEFLPYAQPGPAPVRLHGAVRTAQGVFTGFIQWDRQECLGSDELVGRAAGGDVRLRFDAIRSIARNSRGASLVTLLDGRQVQLTGSRAAGEGHQGLYVDDARYGRVLVSWNAFEAVEFSPPPGGPAYGDFPPGGPLTGSVTTHDGRRFAGRLVFDLDESEFTETLDAPSQGVDYTIPLGLIASIALPGPGHRDARHARVTLHRGGQLDLELSGDLGRNNAGVLVFVSGRPHPEYLPWNEVERIDLDRPPAMFPPLG